MTEQNLTLLEARRDLGNLVTRAQNGEATVITRYGKPAAILAPLGEQARTVKLASGGTVTLSMNVRMLSLSPGDREFVLDLIDLLKRYVGEE